MYPLPLTAISSSRWSTNNPCSEMGQEGMVCLEKVQQFQEFNSNEAISNREEDDIQKRLHSEFLACQFMLEMYRKCMTTPEEFEKRKMIDRARTADQSIHTSGFSIFTWR
ncbi:hypothetical protein FDP41_011573 [Naegleria fowleri]|uniref:Uncharacterized protein n=1 Tax=Naegleria fowleri TaxID=5763 RepID=A0A6A5BX24_NAEFO|nr:uncharacterized protein FDP41_011573 [Naegleria fowleri]KAF0982643.1 hypothetical protein FDP41_011573 [Naegleria fowleri]CAG4717371.1 unnamed protein product [Naegleria fowleri]